jgi:hypothetical protein
MTRSWVSLGDNLNARNDFPAQRERGNLIEFGASGMAGITTAGPHHPARDAGRRASRMILSAAACVTAGLTVRIRLIPNSLALSPFGTQFARNGEGRREILNEEDSRG